MEDLSSAGAALDSVVEVVPADEEVIGDAEKSADETHRTLLSEATIAVGKAELKVQKAESDLAAAQTHLVQVQQELADLQGA